MKPPEGDPHVVERVGVGDTAEGGHQSEDLPADMLVVHPVEGVFHHT